MRIHLISVGQRPPEWVRQGFREYATRLPAECALELVEIPLQRRVKGADVERLRRREGERMLAAVPPGARVVALDESGRQWSTEELADRLRDWMMDGRAVALLVGGPDGLSPECRARADWVWSLSRLAFPHLLVRILVAEQLYRAWSLLRGHPYHRA